MIEGLCDLDILLNPIFLRFSRPNEARVWYPGLSVRRTNILDHCPVDLSRYLALEEPVLSIDRIPPWLISSTLGW